MTKKKKLTIIIVILSTLVALAVVLAVCGAVWSWGPFGDLRNITTKHLAGNADEYDIKHVQALQGSALDGYHICYLGSSVTYGSASCQTSFVEYIAKRNNTTYTKEAVSGTTLVEEGANSYIARMKKLPKDAKYDLFVCQLSTNDATRGKPFGTISGIGAESYDTSTVCGAIEYIVQYVNKTWECPIVFYTGSYYDSAEYSTMVQLLHEIAQVYDIGVIDMYTDTGFNDISHESYSLYMADAIHPTKAGYLLWWTPYMEAYLYDYLAK